MEGTRKIQDRRDLMDQMIVQHDRIAVERIEKLSLLLSVPTHHRTAPSPPIIRRRNHGSRLSLNRLFATKSANCSHMPVSNGGPQLECDLRQVA
jgi:hypothetical protein